jgi:hypothetical protein
VPDLGDDVAVAVVGDAGAVDDEFAHGFRGNRRDARWYRARPRDELHPDRRRSVGDNGALGTAAFIAGLAAVAASAWFGAASLRLRSAVDFLLAVYLVSAGGIVAIVLALSPIERVTRGGVLVATLIFLALTATVWQLRGRPNAPSIQAAVSALRKALRGPVLGLLAAVVACGLAYAAALAVATPANDWDVLWYHLARAAFWHQEQAVGYIEHANNVRLNMNPPAAEILSTWAMTLEGSDRFAALFQLVALVATTLAIVAIGRRLGLSLGASVFGALLFASLPVVALQAATAINDVVETSFVLAVVAFLLTDTRQGLGLGALALALAVATKGTVLFSIPVLLVVAIALSPRRRWLPIAVAGALGIVVGGFWYAVNVLSAGNPAPGYEGRDAVVGHSRLELPAYLARLAVDAVDPAGAVGRDRYLYAVAALLVVTLAVAAAARSRSRSVALAGLGAGGLTLVAVAFSESHDVLLRGYQHVFVSAGEEKLAFLGIDGHPDSPSPAWSWYGPGGLLAFVLAIPLVARAIRQRALPRGALALTLAPVLSLLVIAVTWAYSPWDGRWLMPAVALSATTWGVLLRVRPLSWGLAAVSMVTLLLVFVHYREKPAGISVLEGRAGHSVWTASRSEVVYQWTVDRSTAIRVRWLDAHLEDGDTIGLRLGPNDLSYPYYGSKLEHRIIYVGERGEGLDRRVDWLVVAPGQHAGQCASGWRREFDVGGWRVYRRVGLCPGESAAS